LYRINIKKQQALRALTQSKLDLSNKELSIKKRELEHFANLVREKNKLLSELEEEMMATDDDKKYDQISRLTQSIILTEEDWENFKTIFEEVHVNFFAKLRDKYPDLSISEVRLTSLMKLNLSNKEIGNMLGISPSSVIKSKYRLKKKLQMKEEEKLDTFVVAI
jgi:DNA-binding NarL/FixJ family response regulator